MIISASRRTDLLSKNAEAIKETASTRVGNDFFATGVTKKLDYYNKSCDTVWHKKGEDTEWKNG